ncbi:MAG: EamA family transporter [Anaeromyxobacteraceae bacterium]
MTIGRRATAAGLAAAALFGASTPAAKLLVGDVGPLMLAGLLYAGAGISLMAFAPLRRAREAPLRRGDLPVLLLMIVAGGLAGPVLLVVGLARVSGVTASLLLNVEAPFTILLAVLAFGDHLGRREAVGAAAIVGGAAAMGFAPGPLRADGPGVLAIIAACAAWALDNNLAQRLSLHDPTSVARAKTLAAGVTNVALGLALGDRLPRSGTAAAALAVGAFGYGASIVLHLLATRGLGAARQAALFATAPFIGALVSVPLLGEHLAVRDLVAGSAMAVGLAAVLRARHAHEHAHEAVDHEHAHVHDEHHRHRHAGSVHEPHSHRHAHAALVHDHPHLPDAHHRHDHGGRTE